MVDFPASYVSLPEGTYKIDILQYHEKWYHVTSFPRVIMYIVNVYL